MKKGKRRILPAAALTALICAAIVYCILLHMETSLLGNYEKGEVIVAKKEIPFGMVITPENVDQYFEEKELEKAMIPPKAVLNKDGLCSRRILLKVDPGVVLTESMTESLKEKEDAMREPVVAGFMADDLYQVASGRLRSGDRIHIYMVDKETNEAVLLWDGVLVQEVFNSAGTVITTEDVTTPAQRINVLMEKADVEEFYSELSQGSLRAVKVVRPE